MPDKVYTPTSILDNFSQEQLSKMLTKLEKAKDYAENSDWSRLCGKGII